jgi:hypothetical protein
MHNPRSLDIKRVHARIISSLLIPVFLTFHLHAQEISNPVICGNEIFNQIVSKNYPDLRKNWNSLFDEAKAQGRDWRSGALEVNVVVHVVWKNAVENLDDSIIYNQIAVLNNDFNRLNADSSNLRSQFVPVAGKANIHFNLAAIVRQQTTEDFSIDYFGTNVLPEVKHKDQGGSDSWDPDHYINIWICKIQPIMIFGHEAGQVYGFSFPPNNLPNWPSGNGAPSPDEDGLVIDYRVFGANNPVHT